MSLAEPEPPDDGIFPLLGAFSSQASEATLFLPWGDGMFASPAPLSLGEGTLISPNTVSDLSLEQGSPLVFLFLPSFIGTWYGVGANILASTAFAESSGRGAGHLIRSAFFIQPWKKMVFSVSYHRISDYEVFGGQVLTRVSGWLQSRPLSSVVSDHCFRLPKNNFHIPSCIVLKKY